MDIETLFIAEERSVLEAMKQIEATGRQMLMVAENNTLKAIITDGDVRRHLLRGGKLGDKVKDIANYNPRFIYEKDKDHYREIMKKWSILSLPIVNEKHEIQSIVFVHDYEIGRNHSIIAPVVIMAGGLGTRLHPYTKILPKPLIPIGEIPITEHIINHFMEYHCNEFHLIVNHKKNMIKAYFNETEKDYKLEFHDESMPLGTGGGLSLLKGKVGNTFFLTNCDVLIRANYKEIYDFHKQNGNMITIVAAYKHFTIPYGIINLDSNGEIDTMLEKPEYSFLTNTGFYVVEPDVVDRLEDDKAVGFPDIIEQHKILGEKIGVFPVSEKCWLDMGQMEELEVMRKELGV
ncbi:D-glycero-D-manno-heptose 1-phosphate guanosyltransferase [Desulfosporosinus metallidurans]|uniref:D-glycero-D-manno-heptose 1-phosphate guanosyltransferase n=1 Tax=Desulfosporosinus metallidurans TaxID=1888891 RepID=A0A1Q8R1L5_9FIRM|nr:sugar phosphate nucleotidyltransferase [Desulfosporosinus metallidurans]OLN33519.1 D-glycero-D-manno-heptose 1-phosphate guanosyltransferase [Desulfosporosinus metallidurans]